VLTPWKTALQRLRGNRYLPLALLLVVYSQMGPAVGLLIGWIPALLIFVVLVAAFPALFLFYRRARKQIEKLAQTADRLLTAGKMPEALRECDAAIQILKKRKLPASDDAALLLVIRSIALQKLGKKDEALSSAAQAFACMKVVKKAGAQVAIFDQFGIMMLETGHERQAIPILEAAVGLGQRLESDAMRTAGRLERVGLAYLRVGVHANSVAAFGKAVDIITREKGADALGLTNIYVNLGNGYKRMEKLEDAERCYREALRIYQANSITDAEKLSLVIINIGVVCSETNRHEEAERLYQQVLSMRLDTLGRNHWRVGNTYNNLANCRRRARDFEGAKKYAQQAIEILEQRPQSLCNAVGTLSMIFEDEGKLEEALSAAARARAIQQNVSSPDLADLATRFDREGLLASRCGDEERANDCRASALKIRQALATAPSAERDLTNIQAALETLQQNPAVLSGTV